MGASLVDHVQAAEPVRNFDDHVVTGTRRPRCAGT